MANVFEFVAEARSASGSSAAKVVRRQGKVPAVIYGGSGTPEMLLLDHNEVVKHLVHEAVYSHVLDLKIDGKTEKAVLKHIQRHPAKPVILHMDFMRVDETHKLKVHVPLHFINEAISVGVKKGGLVTHAMADVEVFCMPSALPEFIEVDLASVDVGSTIHLSDLVLPAGVEIAALQHGAEHDHPVAQIVKPRSTEVAE
ncbi:MULTISPECIES: 50S ribosomal protein L25/general stress protein Ctc [Methylomonas]|uniref:Large ribosomal subunit protein bL25 n=2 Tax=Methylomonas TaxID=416 RepID=A0A126T6H9_9GAMM|nr:MULTISPECIES: 50S ribosomal protein L25/general stress protein Ctc [Methylomonas]AMK77697.1 50S ribosomal protein L25/general stress protein Ctc [Methylomonas denitrificans]OAH96811.1 50S ribosomal protein L25/general stress protein Ctc [Methylomonas methanica]TCV86871.1 large subunit ribosomal protein L25 [Methylomonas methanica]